MASPYYTGLEAPFRTLTKGGVPDASGAILDIGRGDWQQGRGNGDPLDRPKWIAVVEIDGQNVHGIAPQRPFAPGPDNGVTSNELDWGSRLQLDLKALGYADGQSHSLVTRIFAGSWWPGGWGDNSQQPTGWEWGHTGASTDSEAVFRQSFVISPDAVPPGPPKPSPPVSDKYPWLAFRDMAKDDLRFGVQLMRSRGVPDTVIKGTRIWRALQILES